VVAKRMIFLTLAVFTALAGRVSAEPFDYPLKKVLIIYDQRVENGAVADLPNALENLLGHFNVDCTQLPDKRYRKGSVDDYDVIFYLKSGNEPVKKTVLSGLLSTDATVCWMGRGLGEITENRSDFGFKITGEYDNLVTLGFRGESYPCDLYKTPVISADETWVVDATAADGPWETPIIMHRDNFWVVSKMAFFEVEGLVFAELLHDIMAEDHPLEMFAYLRLEDVNPTYDPEKLRAVADLLYERKIPYMVGIIPAYTDPVNNRRVYISEVSEFAEAIRYMQARGGIPVLHGYTHQASDKERSGEGYEFWDGDSDAPLPRDDAELFSRTIVTSLEECLANGIYPLTWESPHYASSEAGYEATALHFTVVVEALQLSDLTCMSTLEAPYVLWKDRFGRTAITGNCGYVHGDYEESVDAAVAAAERLKIIRDPTAMVFFHPYINSRYLEMVVNGFEEAGYVFADIRNMPCEVNAGSAVYRTGPGPLTIEAENDYIKTYYLSTDYEPYDDEFSDERVGGLFAGYSRAGPKGIYVAERWSDPTSRRYVGERGASWFFIGDVLDLSLKTASSNVILTLIWAFAILVSAFLLYLVTNYVTRAVKPNQTGSRLV
jgi:hypothetical protein